VSVAEARFYTLPDTAYNLWVRGELADLLHLPNDGTRVEVIGGEIVVSPGPNFAHNGVGQDLQRALFAAEMADPGFPWRCVHTQDLNLIEIQDGYIPDLIVLDTEIYHKARRSQAQYVLPDQVALVAEVTSRWNAADDREPGPRRSTATKWNGYAKVGIAHYLVVDRDPGAAQTILFSNPVQRLGTYRHLQTWEFGEPIRLPEPFGFEIPTHEWEPWSE
jgi:hypothetical protein